MSKTVQKVKILIFEIHESNTSGPQGPPRGVYFAHFDILREKIDSCELGDVSYALLASSQAILGLERSKNVRKSSFRVPKI